MVVLLRLGVLFEDGLPYPDAFIKVCAMADGDILLEWRSLFEHRAHCVSVELSQETELSHGVCLIVCAGVGGSERCYSATSMWCARSRR